ncbi:COX15/CtaA family protein [bacterium]|nr:COX15/CtaA family protein [bacterium]
MNTESYSTGDAWVHRLAVLLMILTLGLLFLGGLVTSHEVGMAVPDWPATYGENMFTYNFFDKSWGIQLEHTHRLAGSVIGLVTVALSIAIYRVEKRISVRWLGLAALVGVVIQGVLGGGRVVLNAILGQHLAAVHGCFAQAFFATVVILVAVTSRSYRQTSPATHDEAGSLQRASLFLAVAVYLQMVLGAVVRHYQGSLWMVHLALGAILMFAALWVMMLTILHPPLRKVLGTPVMILGGGLAAQITLGIVALFLTGILDTEPHNNITVQEAVTVTTHLALGSILLGTSVYLAVASRRYIEGPTSSPAPSRLTLEPAR